MPHVRPSILLRFTLALLALLAAPLGAQTVRIVQTNAAGDDIHLIDPTTQSVVGVIEGIPIPHGVTSAPDGSELYFSNEVDHTLDVVSTESLRVVAQVPLSGRPNNVSITPDGRKVYVAITGADAFVDVIDVRTRRRAKSIPTAGGVHNVYVMPGGQWVAAGMIGARTLTVIDARTDEPAWSMEFDGGVRPMAFERNPDGSTKRIFVQISDFHGFYGIDFATRAVTDTVRLPELPISRVSNDALQGSPAHGFAVSPDGTQLWSTSKPNSHVYAYSLPDLEYLGGVEVGHDPDWLTMTPDGRWLYSANAGSNTVTVIDARELRAAATIPVGQVPKRNHTAVIASAPAAAQRPLDFDTYRAEVEPIFIAPRGGHGPGMSPCATCHVSSGTPLRLQPLRERPDGSVYWSEEDSRRNFQVVAGLVTPGQPERSRLLRKALAEEAGGTAFHVGGKFFDSRDDPEWRRMADWVSAADALPEGMAPEVPPALDFDFFRTCVQRVFLDKREGRVECVHCHGAGLRGFASGAPEDGGAWSDEASRENFRILGRYVEPGRPLMSRFLTHPLAPEAGGDPYHGGGRRWMSQDDPEWRMLAAWVRGERPSCLLR